MNILIKIFRDGSIPILTKGNIFANLSIVDSRFSEVNWNKDHLGYFKKKYRGVYVHYDKNNKNEQN